MTKSLKVGDQMTPLYPDYTNSILNITASLLKYYGIDIHHNSDPIVDAYLSSGSSHVIQMVFDGMGYDLLEKFQTDVPFLWAHVKKSMTSVYPCTTTAAMTSYYSGLSPLEHGWLGWSLYFKEFARTIDTFSNRDTYDKESVGTEHAAHKLLDYKTIFSKIAEAKLDIQITLVLPEGILVSHDPIEQLHIHDLPEAGDLITSLLDDDVKRYIMFYWHEPDLTIHKTGTGSASTIEQLKQIEAMVQRLKSAHPDDRFIISADHGLTDIDETIYLNEDSSLMEMLILPPFIEPRCSSFFVKKGAEARFSDYFLAQYGDDFYLYNKEAFLTEGLLGTGRPHPKVDDFLGDYLAVAKGHKILKYRTHNLKVDYPFKGHHAGLRPEEMRVPLILL